MVTFCKNLSPKGSPGSGLPGVRKVFLSLCKEHRPGTIVLKIPYGFWESQSRHLGRVVNEVRRLAKKERIKIVEVAPKTVRKDICGNEKATKEELTEASGRFYPELKEYLCGGRACRGVRWGKLVESVSAGVWYLMKSHPVR